MNASALTDDALARALDKLAAAGPKAVYGATALRARLHEDITDQGAHFDTTSRSLYRQYPDLDPEDLQLVRGYSKDGHPKLKQLVLALLTNRQRLHSSLGYWTPEQFEAMLRVGEVA